MKLNDNVPENLKPVQHASETKLTQTEQRGWGDFTSSSVLDLQIRSVQCASDRHLRG